jgi:hypothetical protein
VKGAPEQRQVRLLWFNCRMVNWYRSMVAGQITIKALAGLLPTILDCPCDRESSTDETQLSSCPLRYGG